MDNLENAFSNPEPMKQEMSQPQYNNNGYSNGNYSSTHSSGGNNNYKSNNNWKSNNNNWKNKNGNKKPTFDKDNVGAIKIDNSKIHFSLNYRCYAGIIASNVEILDQNLLERTKLLINKLEAKGYLFRGNDPKEGMQEFEKKNKAILNSMVTEYDKLYSGFAFNNDVSKEKHFGVVKGLHTKYSDLKDVIKAFLAKDVGIVLGDFLNRPITLCLIIALPDVNVKEETDFRKLGNLSFLINVLKVTNRPFFNIANDDDYKEALEFVEKLP